MREIIINKNDAGTKLEKFLIKYFNSAPASFTYKMIRKKNIKVNDVNANGKEILQSGDIIKVYISDETFLKFRTENNEKKICTSNSSYFDPDVVYEDENIIVINKPVGILSQKSKPDDISINEITLEYLKKQNYSVNNDNAFKPSVCNRLDRNTEGLILFAKTYICATIIAEALKYRTIHKYYYCVVVGRMEDSILINGYLSKNEANNTVTISEIEDNNGSLIKTKINPVLIGDRYSLLEIELITGKTHQIRAHLASIGHPILGDYKYGNRRANDILKRKYGVNYQLLISHKLVFPTFNNELSNLSEKVISLEMPELYKEIVYGNME